MKRVFNFSAGPAVLPKPVLEQVQRELLSYQSSGMSVMELSHRSILFEEIIASAENLLRELMTIPKNYQILFLQGGASLRFSMVPLNLAQKQKIAFVHTGSWAKKAIQEAKKLAQPEIIASSADQNFSYIPEIPAIDSKAAYLHITTNNTIEGTAIRQLPDTKGVPLVADMSSNILAEDYDVTRFGLVYAGAQKNIGPAGLTVVIIRDDLLENIPADLPAMLDYRIHAKNHSLYNTPPTFTIYTAKLVFEWLKNLGGIPEIERQNKVKAELLYDYIDQSDFFKSPVIKQYRSLTNIPFMTMDPDKDRLFIQQAEENGLMNLKGHRSVGGMRASLYNAFPLEGVHELLTFMDDFAKRYDGGRKHV